MPNKLGRDPLELASINYHVDHPYRAEVLFLLRWHRPGHSSSSPLDETIGDDPTQHHQNRGVSTTFTDDDEVLLLPADIFSQTPPNNMYMASAVCVACMENPSDIAILPCGHICLCRTCVCSTSVLRCGKCPIGRCEVVGLYQQVATIMHSEEEEEEKTLCRCDQVLKGEMRKCKDERGQRVGLAC